MKALTSLRARRSARRVTTRRKPNDDAILLIFLQDFLFYDSRWQLCDLFGHARPARTRNTKGSSKKKIHSSARARGDLLFLEFARMRTIWDSREYENDVFKCVRL